MNYSINKLRYAYKTISSTLIIFCLIIFLNLPIVKIYAETEKELSEKLHKEFVKENVSAWVVIQLVKDILALKDRPLIFYDADGNLHEATDATFHSQTLYDGCYMLIHNSDDPDNPEIMKVALDWAQKIEEKHSKCKIHLPNQVTHPIIPETAILKMDIYKNLNDKERYADTLINTFSSYGTMEYNSFEYNSYYGLELLYKLMEAKEVFGSDFIFELLDKMYEQAQSRLLKSAILYQKGNLLSEMPENKDRAIDTYKTIIVEYAEEEYRNFMWYQNFAQFSLLNSVKLLPTENDKVAFIKQYTDESTPFPVRYFALYLLAYGEGGLLSYGEQGVIKPDPKYKKIFDEIRLPEDKKYWFNQ